MSSIEKMTIQGIRSYGPREQDTQIIEFFLPVTLIVGQNGCGKTTIIECLKYATTGDMPPNTKGTSFLFDPKLIDEVETKGKIKLFFKDTNGMNVQLQKNLSSAQKLKKLEFRTAETIISRYNDQNKIISTITSKCINADNEIVNAFGVSKAVLEHVIFCHQEDSNWPLSEGKILKTRFDEIFSATKYIKTLDILRKIRIEKQQLIKQMEIERKHLETYKLRSDQLRKDLQENMNKKNGFIKQKEVLIEKLKPIESQLNHYMKESARFIEVKNQINKMENEKTLLEKQIKEYLVATQNCKFTGSDSELKEYINNFNNKNTDSIKQDESKIKDWLNILNNQLIEANEKKTKLMIENEHLEIKKKVYNDKERELENLILQLRKIKILNSGVSDWSHELMINVLSEHIEETKKDLDTTEDSLKKIQTQFQEEIDYERDNRSKIDQNIMNKSELIEKFTAQINHLNNELNEKNDSILTELNEKINNLEESIENSSRELKDNQSLNKMVEKLEKEKLNLKEKEAKLNCLINKFHFNSKYQVEHEMLKKDKDIKMDQIRKIKIRINDDISSFFSEEIPLDDTSLKSKYENICKSLVKNLNEYENKQKETEKLLFSNEIKRKNDLESIRLKENELREYEDRIMNELYGTINDNTDLDRYDDILNDLKEKQKCMIDEKGYIAGVEKTYKKFLSDLSNKQNKDHSCPVCLRLFKNTNELEDTILELNKYTNNLPCRNSELEGKLSQVEVILTKMIELKSFKTKYDNIKSHELKNLQTQIQILDQSVIKKLRHDLNEINEVLIQLRNKKAISEKIQNDIVLIDKYANECIYIDKKIQLNESSLVLLDETDEIRSTQSLESLENEKKDLNMKICQIDSEIEEIRSQIINNYKLIDKLNNLKENLNNQKSNRNELIFKMQNKARILEQKNEIIGQYEETEREIIILKKNLEKSVDKIENINIERKIKFDEYCKLIKNYNDKLNNLTQIKTSIHECSLVVKDFENNDKINLEKISEEIKKTDSHIKNINNEIDLNRAKLDEKISDLARYEIKQRQLSDLLNLRLKRAELDNINNELKEKKYDGKIDLIKFLNEQKILEKSKDDFYDELNSIKTSINILNGKLQTLEEEANLDTHKCALEKYLICSSDLRVLELCVNDIDKYYKALDRAVMNYHLLKMNEINKTIKQLWRQVYRGNDIDYIEIRSEEEGQNEDREVKLRRVYNYRVVLIKGDTQLDMRGRCSAGQKVLASIIIRLALAETFCLNSGILALDEPTTNLDRENIESLASALVDIIKSRSKQKNFQLIIITHDEDFVEMLGRSEYMDQFYRVEKDERGFSTIKRRSNLN